MRPPYRYICTDALVVYHLVVYPPDPRHGDEFHRVEVHGVRVLGVILATAIEIIGWDPRVSPVLRPHVLDALFAARAAWDCG